MSSPTEPARRTDLLPRLAFFCACLFFACLYGLLAARYDWFPQTWFAAALDEFEGGDEARPDMSLHHVHRARHDLEGVRTYGPQPDRDDVVLVTGFWPDRGDGPGVRILDRAGEELHHWEIDPSAIWPESPHRDAGSGFFNLPTNYVHGSYLFPDGDLVFNIEFLGLARVDAAGDLLWRVDERTHHSVTRAADGNFWVCMVRWIEDEQQRRGRYRGLRLPLAEDCALEVSPDGQVLRTISMLDVVWNSAMKEQLWRVGRAEYGDVLHMNDVEPLPPELADEYPLFDAGDLLVSLRHVDCVFVVDPDTLEVKWSAHGPFMRQHDPDFVGDGWISVFDNRNDGSLDGGVLGGSRLWLMRPHTGERRQVYPPPSDPDGRERAFYTSLGGKAQRLDGGRWLLTEAQFGRVFEIDADGRTIWEWGAQRRADGATIYEALEGSSYPLTPAEVAAWSHDG